jgi:hypothetical protein
MISHTISARKIGKKYHYRAFKLLVSISVFILFIADNANGSTAQLEKAANDLILEKILNLEVMFREQLSLEGEGNEELEETCVWFSDQVSKRWSTSKYS